MKNALMVCNTPYQIFVAAWIRKTKLKNCNADILISDHMANGDLIAQKTMESGAFSNVYYVRTKEFCKNSFSRKDKLICLANLDGVLCRYVKLKKKYDFLYVANVDRFSQLVYFILSNARFSKLYNKNLKLYIYEDGTSSYSKLFEKYYKSCRLNNNRRLKFYNPKVIYKNVEQMLVFDKECILWDPDMQVQNIEKISVGDKEFIETVNTIFNFKNCTDIYDKKYIFMEESFYTEGCEVNDVEIVEKIATIVGKENIMVKIHPRNLINRFKNLGYKTNENIYVPWEVFVLNFGMEDKVLLTFASTAIINPYRIFGKNIKAYSLYKCLDEKPSFLNGPLWDSIETSYKKYYPMIEICDSNFEKTFNKKG